MVNIGPISNSNGLTAGICFGKQTANLTFKAKKDVFDLNDKKFPEKDDIFDLSDKESPKSKSEKSDPSNLEKDSIWSLENPPKTASKEINPSEPKEDCFGEKKKSVWDLY